MKSKIIIFILAFCTLSAVTSCTDRKQQLINKLEKLSKKLDRQGNDLSITQWQQAAKQFKQLNEDIAKNYQDYSPKQLHEIGRLKGICVGAFSRYLSHTLDKSSNEIDGYLQGIEEICGKQDAAYPDDIEIEDDSVVVDSL